VWLPTPVYEKAPHYWLLLGLLFIVVGMYLGYARDPIFIYTGIAVGVACCAWGIRVLAKRAKRSEEPDQH
jgi:hypothetical protein